MRFLADENCDAALVVALRRAGHDVLKVAEVIRGADDVDVIGLAVRERRVLLTEDKELAGLFHASAPEIGVVLLRYGFRSRDALCETLVALVAQRGESLRGRLAVVTPGRSRLAE